MSKAFIVIVPALIFIFIRLKPTDLLFRTFNTLVHELSHAFVAVLFRQKVQKIVLNKDFSGTCITKISNKKSMFFISLAGYLFPSALGYGFIRLTEVNITSTTFYVIMIISVTAIICAVANSFGRVWTIGFASLNFIFALADIFQPYYKHIIYIYACTLLIENILSTVTLLYITLVSPKKSGDAALLQKATKIPAIVWTLLFVGFSVLMFYLSIAALAK